ncbi:MAG: 2,3-diaminopropionate biosynthesis protein SbnA [Cyclobacteriaceae bacterium]
MKHYSILDNVGNTPVVSIDIPDKEYLTLQCKIEGYNPTGSVKDRAASYILKKLLQNNTIDQSTVIIESTSGNFGVALSTFCKHLNLKFIAVVDPYITSMNEMLIRANGAKIIKVQKPDEYGGYLLNRIAKVKEIQASLPNTYWVNQYANPLNAKAYYNSLGKEICYQTDELDYLFLGISSGGTICGVSQKVKENFPNAKIIAVDVEGSRIFSENATKKRFIPGIGSSMRPAILDHAIIDDVVMVNEEETVEGCHQLLNNHNLFVGGSSGSVYTGIQKYFQDKHYEQKIYVATVFPDRGERYFDTIYNQNWLEGVIAQKEAAQEVLS